jgi:hypothetical protein
MNNILYFLWFNGSKIKIAFGGIKKGNGKE